MIEVIIGSSVYSGWDSLTISRSMESITNSFSLSYMGYADIKKGDTVKIKYKGSLIFDGRIESKTRSHSTGGGSNTIQGREITGELVKGSVVGVASFAKKSISSIVSDICKPFGITVIGNKKAETVVEKFVVETAETAQAAISRLLNMYGCNATTIAGILYIVNEDNRAVSDTIVEGVNILSISESDYDTDIYSKYIVKGQQSVSKGYGSATGTANNSGYNRYCPLVIVADNVVSASSAKAKADWEKKTRQAKSYTLSVDLPRWEQSTGAMWMPNSITKVVHNTLRIDKEMLISSVSLSYSTEGESCSLELIEKGVFQA